MMHLAAERGWVIAATQEGDAPVYLMLDEFCPLGWVWTGDWKRATQMAPQEDALALLRHFGPTQIGPSRIVPVP